MGDTFNPAPKVEMPDKPSQTVAANATSRVAESAAVLSDLKQQLFGSTSVQQGAMLLVAGTGFEFCRRFSTSALQGMLEKFVITARIESDKNVYDHLLFWLKCQPFFQQHRSFDLTDQAHKHNYEADSDSDSDSESEVEDILDDNPLDQHYRIPADGEVHTFFYRDRLFQASHKVEVRNDNWTTKFLSIRVYSQTPTVLDQLVHEAKWAYKRKFERRVKVSTYTTDNDRWTRLMSKKKRSWDTLLLPAGVKESLLEDAHNFMESKKWYASRGIPHRRGYLLYGKPGPCVLFNSNAVVRCLLFHLVVVRHWQKFNNTSHCRRTQPQCVFFQSFLH